MNPHSWPNRYHPRRFTDDQRSDWPNTVTDWLLVVLIGVALGALVWWGLG
jgi:hypothetical protein